MALDFSHPIVVRARNAARKSGVLAPFKRLYGRLWGGAYEPKFARAILARVAAGDIVWDVGANIGFYSRQFAELAGADGLVVAFEPSPQTFERLRDVAAQFGNIQCRQIALADSIGEAEFYVGSAGNGETNSFAASHVPDRTAIRVKITRGEAFATENPRLSPSVIKIDVEGFELEVVKGLGELLNSPALRAVFIEMHFEILAERGLKHGPRAIVERLKSSGFETAWIDPSHLSALRPARAQTGEV